MLQRRGFLGALAATLCAPAIIRTPGLLMPVRPLPPASLWLAYTIVWDPVVKPDVFLLDNTVPPKGWYYSARPTTEYAGTTRAEPQFLEFTPSPD